MMPLSSCKDKVTSTETNKPPLATRFELFPQLPPEIRREIWRLAIPPTKGVCILPPHYAAASNEEFTVRNPYSPLTRTCTEAREICLENSPLTRDFHPETDILYVSGASFDNFCRICHEPWPARLRHIAIALPLSGERTAFYPYRNPLPLEHLHELDKISIVYPKAVGTV